MKNSTPSTISAEHEQRATILIVDDEAANLAVLSRFLQDHYRVRAARSGEQALRAVDTEPRPDLVLLDIMMPEMDGYTVLSKIRAMPDHKNLPVIFVTALSADEDEERGLNLGAVDYLTKPLRPPIVLARVKNHLELKAARDLLTDQNAALEAKVAERTKVIKLALDRVNNANAALRKTYFEMVRAISSLVELRGGGGESIGLHSRRVADLARQVAQQMSMSDEEVQDVFIASLLHDIGKIGFPDDLLRKPVNTLRPEELAMYHAHPTIAANALKGIDSLVGVAEIIRNHHERFDGTGFPSGRSGFDIPLGARIICAISDYDDLRMGVLTSMTMNAKQRIQYLLEGRGHRYDPAVIAKLEPLLAPDQHGQVDEVRVSAAHLMEGMMLSRDVIHPDDFLLLSTSTVMSRRLIDQMVAVEKDSGRNLEIYVLREQFGK